MLLQLLLLQMMQPSRMLRSHLPLHARCPRQGAPCLHPAATGLWRYLYRSWWSSQRARSVGQVDSRRLQAATQRPSSARRKGNPRAFNSSSHCNANLVVATGKMKLVTPFLPIVDANGSLGALEPKWLRTHFAGLLPLWTDFSRFGADFFRFPKTSKQILPERHKISKIGPLGTQS